MPRCGCASDRCTCNFIAGDNVSVSGTGSRSNPYVFSVYLPEEATAPNPDGTGRLPGEIVAYGGPSAPAGWLLCDGSLVDRDQFSALFAIIGTAYGPGDGLTTFKLPDLVGAFPFGSDSGHPRGSDGGDTGTRLETRHLPLHSHSMVHTHTINHDHSMIASGGHDHSLSFSTNEGGSKSRIPEGSSNGTGTGSGAIASDGSHTHNIVSHSGNSGASSASNTGNAGQASPDEIDTMPPYVAVNYLIKT